MNKFKLKLVDINKALVLAITSLGAIVSFNTSAKAQDNSGCYMINPSGEFVDLSSLCHRSSQRPSQNQNRAGANGGGVTNPQRSYYTQSTTVVPQYVPVFTEVEPIIYSRYYYPYRSTRGFYRYYPKYRTAYRPYRRYRSRVRPRTYRRYRSRVRPHTYRRYRK